MTTDRPAQTESEHDATRTVRFFRHPVTGVVTVVLSMFVMILGIGLISAGFYLLAQALTGAPAAGMLRTVLKVASFAMTTVVAVLLILLWRNLAHLPMTSFGLRPASRTWLLVPGFALAIGVNYAAAGLAVVSGASSWGPLQFTPELVMAVVVIFLGQAFPEELLWRGHLAGLLSRRLGRIAVMITTAVAFGAIHIVSGSDAQGLGEQLLYVLQAIGLGFLMAAMRYGTASLWMAIGFHTGYNAFFEAAVPIPGSYGTELIIRAVLLIACAVPLLIALRIRRTPK